MLSWRVARIAHLSLLDRIKSYSAGRRACLASDDVSQAKERFVGQVDRILGVKSGTSQRWIDGYKRNGKTGPPVIRTEHTGEEIVTWGEFIEARFLAEYRHQGVPLIKMRPAVEKLREELNTLYPLASAQTWLAVEGRELVRKVQDDVGLHHRLLLVVVRTDQQMLDWSPQAQEFADSLH